jgi:hypothetical protein
MSRKTMNLFSLAVLAMSPGSSRSEDATKAIPVLEVSLVKEECIAGQPLIVRLVAANRSSKKMTRYYWDDEDFDTRTVIFTFVSDGRSEVFATRLEGRGGFGRELRLDEPPMVDPSTTWQCKKMFVPTHRHDDTYTVLPAGRYRLSAKAFLPGGKPVDAIESSSSVEVQIVDPTGDDAKALALLGPAGMAAFFSGVAGGKPAEIEKLLAEYPQSTYARYAQARLILDRARHWWDTQSPSSASDREKLRALVAEGRAYIRRFPDMPLNDNILLYCARMQAMARDEEGSARTLQELIRDYPQSEMIQTARKHMEDWGRSHPAFRSTQPASQTQPSSLREGPAKRIGVVVLPGASSKPSGN